MSFTPDAVVRLKKVNHRGHTVILLQHPYNPTWWNLIKALPNAIYSQTYRGHYIPYTSQAFKAFCALGLPYRLPDDATPRDTVERSTPKDDNISIASTDATSVPSPMVDPPRDTDISDPTPSELEVSWSAQGFAIATPYSPDAVAFLKGLEKCWWSKKDKKWYAKSGIHNLEKIQHQWSCYSVDRYGKIYEQISRLQSPMILEIYTTPERAGSVILKVKGYKSDAYIIKQYAHRQYDKNNRRWILPYNDTAIKEIVGGYKKAGYKIINNLPIAHTNADTAAQRKSRALNIFLAKFSGSNRTFVESYCDVIMRQGKSLKTATAYTGALINLMQYHGVDDLAQLNEAQVNAYISHIAKQGMSDSMLNRVVSAIKLWIKYLSNESQWSIKDIQRPKKHRSIPTVLSVKEMKRFIDQVDNLKHLCMISTMYGSGLRVGELLQLRLSHIYWDRKQLHIQGAKGKKDRIVNISNRLMEDLRHYFDQYQPVRYLFEGTKKGQPYSYSSVRQFIHRYARRANIAKRVTPHLLRHSFATHLMDNGVALPYIQKLLGHKDIKTTLIYTHLSNDSIDNIKSPLDEL